MYMEFVFNKDKCDLREFENDKFETIGRIIRSC